MRGPLEVHVDGHPIGVMVCGAYAEPGATVTFLSGGVPMWSGTLEEPEKAS